MSGTIIFWLLVLASWVAAISYLITGDAGLIEWLGAMVVGACTGASATFLLMTAFYWLFPRYGRRKIDE